MYAETVNQNPMPDIRNAEKFAEWFTAGRVTALETLIDVQEASENENSPIMSSEG